MPWSEFVIGDEIGPLIRLGEQDREIVAAWFVVLLAVAAGLSFFSIQRYAASDCSTTLAMPRVPTPTACRHRGLGGSAVLFRAMRLHAVGARAR